MARLARDLPPALRHPLTVPAARAILARRRVERPGAFLDLMREAVYGHAPSVYRRLLRHVGCEYGDLERLVRQDDVEGALRRLLAAGVYLTVDESKGRQPVVSAIKGWSRLLVGPFKDGEEAQEFVNDLHAAKLEGFVWTAPSGLKLEKLASK